MDKLHEGLIAYQEKVASGEIERAETTHNWIVRAAIIIEHTITKTIANSATH